MVRDVYFLTVHEPYEEPGAPAEVNALIALTRTPGRCESMPLAIPEADAELLAAAPGQPVHLITPAGVTVLGDPDRKELLAALASSLPEITGDPPLWPGNDLIQPPEEPAVMPRRPAVHSPAVARLPSRGPSYMLSGGLRRRRTSRGQTPRNYQHRKAESHQGEDCRRPRSLGCLAREDPVDSRDRRSRALGPVASGGPADVLAGLSWPAGTPPSQRCPSARRALDRAIGYAPATPTAQSMPLGRAVCRWGGLPAG